MDKNSLIIEIKNDINSIKKQVDVTLAKLTVLESMIELDNKLGISVQTSGEPSSLELSRRVDDRQGIMQPEITSEASNEELEVKEEPKIEPVVEAPVVAVEPIVEPEPVVEEESEQDIVEIEQVIELEIEEKEEIIEEENEEEKLSASQMISGVAQQNSSELDSAFTSTEIPHSSLLTPRCETEPRNLMSVIGLNDRFRFRHDLFSNSDEIFKETIDILNKVENFEKAVEFLTQKFAWDEEDATVVYFYDIIKPKF